MVPEARSVWAALEFRMPMMRRNVEPLADAQLQWIPAPGRNSIAWQIWHIAEVEDNWIRTCLLGQEPVFPLGSPLAQASGFPPAARLLAYLDEVRALTRARLEAMREPDFDAPVHDPDFGTLSGRDLWAGVVTSFAWHAGQIAMTAKLVPASPVTTWTFTGWADAPRAPLASPRSSRMNRQQVLAAALRESAPLLLRFTSDFDEPSRVAQRPHLPNHLAWILGHCALTMHRAAEKLDGANLPDGDYVTGDGTAGTRDRFDTESVSFASTPVPDSARYPTLARSLEIFERAARRLADAFEHATDEQLGQTFQWGQAALTPEALATRIINHNGTHTGQLVDLRRALGMPRVIG